MQALRVLLVEDSADDAQLLVHALRRGGFAPIFEQVSGAAAMRSALTRQAWEVVISDHALPRFSGEDALELLMEMDLKLPFIVVSGTLDEETAVQYIKRGAADYLLKDRLGRLGEAVRRALREVAAEQEREAANRQIRELNLQLERRVARLDALHRIDMVINASLDLNLTLQTVLDQVVEQLEVDAAAILLFYEPDLALTYAASKGFRGTAIRQSRLRLGEGTSGRAALERRPLSVHDLSEDGLDFVRGELIADEGFVSHYTLPLIAKGRLLGVLEVFHRQLLSFTEDWLSFANTLAAQTSIAVDNAVLFDYLQHSNLELRLAYDTTIEGWSRALDLRDHETEGHSRRVADLTMRLARQMGVSEEELIHVRWGALLHDIGKMGVQDRILLKPGNLTEAEWLEMKKHPELGYTLLSPIRFLKPALEIPYCHHEKWDGTGYPRGLKREQIPLAARIFAVSDVYDALSSDRPYRKAWPREQVTAYIHEQVGKHFDPEVADVFLRTNDVSPKEA